VSPSANVRSIEALSELRTALVRYRAEVQASLRRLEQERQRTQAWLAERQRHWQFQVRQCQDAVRQAQAALARCQSSAHSDPKSGRRHIPDCHAYEAALVQARARLRAAEGELQNVQRWMRLVDEAGTDYQRRARRLTTFVETDLVEAQVVLERKAAALNAYTLTTSPSGTSIVTTPPTQALASAFTTSVALGALGLVGAAVHLTTRMAADVRHALGDVAAIPNMGFLGEDAAERRRLSAGAKRPALPFPIYQIWNCWRS